MGALVSRARQQAAQAAEQVVVQGQQYLTFTVSGELFGIAIASIKEIIEYRAPTDVPMMPGYMRGIINLRGRVVPVIDLSVRFGRARTEETRRTCIVILEIEQQGEQHDIGIAVDTVSAVLEIADADIEPAPSFGARLRTDFIKGMGKLGEKFVILLDIGKVLSVEELSLLAAAGEGPAALSGIQSARLEGPSAQGARLAAPGTSGAVTP
jgi:purine-binding chemotaxis protein CheW